MARTNQKYESISHPDSTSIRRLRETIAERVESTSVRQIAREIGMSPTGLKKFLEGTAPYSPTLRRLRSWYVHYAAVAGGEVVEYDASTALAVLVHDLSPGARQETVEEMLEALARGYDGSKKPRPDWLSRQVEQDAKHPPASRPSALGKYGHIRGTSDDFARLKQAEIDREDGRAA